jgi:hypothetical protein
LASSLFKTPERKNARVRISRRRAFPDPGFLALSLAGTVRRHARHVMVMTMMVGADWHS